MHENIAQVAHIDGISLTLCGNSWKVLGLMDQQYANQGLYTF